MTDRPFATIGASEIAAGWERKPNHWPFAAGRAEPTTSLFVESPRNNLPRHACMVLQKWNRVEVEVYWNGLTITR